MAAVLVHLLHRCCPMVSHFEYMTNGSERHRQTDTATDRPLFYHFPLDAASIIKAMHYADLNFSQGTENCKKLLSKHTYHRTISLLQLPSIILYLVFWSDSGKDVFQKGTCAAGYKPDTFPVTQSRASKLP